MQALIGGDLDPLVVTLVWQGLAHIGSSLECAKQGLGKQQRSRALHTVQCPVHRLLPSWPTCQPDR